MPRLSTFLSAAVLCALTSPAALAQDTGSILVNAPLFKTKESNGVVKFTPFKSAKDPFVVTVRLYDGTTGEPILDEDGVTPWAEEITVTTLDAAPSNPAAGDLREPTKIAGRADIVIGASKPLPPDLVRRDALFTTQVTTTKGGVALATFAESPRRPLGVDGTTRGQALDPDAIATHALAVLDGAAVGRVLTSDADGNATWQELPAGPGVTGTVGRLAVFDSAASITDSLVSQSVSGVTIDGDLVAGSTQLGNLTTLGDVLAGDDLVASDSVTAANQVVAGGNGSFGGSVSVGGNLNVTGIVRAGNPSTIPNTGDVAADDDLIADDDLQVGDSASIGGVLTVSGGTFLSTLNAANTNVASLVSSTTVATGAPTVAFAAGDIASTSDVMADEDVIANTGVVRTGSPTSTFADGDVVATNDLVADVDVIATGGVVRAGSPSTQTLTSGDVGATDDLIADDDVLVGDDVITGDDVIAGGLISVGGTFVDNLTATQSELQFRSNGDQVFIRDFNFGDNGTVDETLWFDGPAGLGGDLEMRLNAGGGLSIDGNFTSGGADLAEWFPARDDSLEPGTLVALDPSAPEHVLRAELGRFEVLLGVVPTAPGLLMGGGDIMGPQPELLRASFVAAEQGDLELARELREIWRASVDDQSGRVAVALQGRVPVKLDLSGGVVQPGDRIGLGATPGHGARYTGYGPVVGIAMEAYTGGAAPIVVFLDRDLSPDASSAPIVSADEIASRLQGEGAAPFVGTGTFPAGRTQVWVDDARLTADSLPVVTFYGNPGGASWVSARMDGAFLLELAEPASQPIAFGYTATR